MEPGRRDRCPGADRASERRAVQPDLAGVAVRSEGGLDWFFTNGHGQCEPYQRVVDQGLIRVKTGSYENSRTGELVMTITPRFTAKALDAIARHLGAAA